jgi:hypothetical protein
MDGRQRCLLSTHDRSGRADYGFSALPAGDNIALGYDAASHITGITETGFPAESFSYNTLDRLHIYARGAATKTYA